MQEWRCRDSNPGHADYDPAPYSQLSYTAVVPTKMRGGSVHGRNQPQHYFPVCLSFMIKLVGRKSPKMKKAVSG